MVASLRCFVVDWEGADNVLGGRTRAPPDPPIYLRGGSRPPTPPLFVVGRRPPYLGRPDVDLKMGGALGWEHPPCNWMGLGGAGAPPQNQMQPFSMQRPLYYGGFPSLPCTHTGFGRRHQDHGGHPETAGSPRPGFRERKGSNGFILGPMGSNETN